MNSTLRTKHVLVFLCLFGFASGGLLRLTVSKSPGISRRDGAVIDRAAPPSILAGTSIRERSVEGLTVEETARLRNYLERKLLSPEERAEAAQLLARWGSVDPVGLFSWWRGYDYRYLEDMSGILEADQYLSLLDALVEADRVFAFRVLEDWSGYPGFAYNVAVRLITTGPRLDANQAKTLIDRIMKVAPLISRSDLLGAWLHGADPKEARAYLAFYTSTEQLMSHENRVGEVLGLDEVLSAIPVGQRRDQWLINLAFGAIRDGEVDMDAVIESLSGITSAVSRTNAAVGVARRLGESGNQSASEAIVEAFSLGNQLGLGADAVNTLSEKAGQLLADLDFEGVELLLASAPSDYIAQSVRMRAAAQLGATDLSQALHWIAEADLTGSQDRLSYARKAIYANAMRTDPVSAVETVMAIDPEFAPALDMALGMISDLQSVSRIFESQIPVEHRETLVEKYIQRKTSFIPGGRLAEFRREVLAQD